MNKLMTQLLCIFGLSLCLPTFALAEGNTYLYIDNNSGSNYTLTRLEDVYLHEGNLYCGNKELKVYRSSSITIKSSPKGMLCSFTHGGGKININFLVGKSLAGLNKAAFYHAHMAYDGGHSLLATDVGSEYNGTLTRDNSNTFTLTIGKAK